MEKKLSDYLHFYLGCEVIGTYSDQSESRGYLTGVMNGSYECEIQFIEEDGINVSEEPVWNDIKEVKPILRFLSDMKEDERKELWELIFGRPFHQNGSTVFIDKRTHYNEPRWVLSSGVERLGIEMNGTVWADSDLIVWKHNQHEVTRWLLSKGFDLFNLIEQGLAIDKAQS